ncbi:hypothetical protein GCM10027288_44170 [Bordetella tumbae]
MASYIFFATAAGLYLGLIFGKVCAHFNSTGQAAQLISWVDAMGRSAGAAFLALLGAFDQESIGMVWALLFGIAALGHLWLRFVRVGRGQQSAEGGDDQERNTYGRSLTDA